MTNRTSAAEVESDYMVDVCEACRTAACWHGTFLCAESKHADVISVPASVLAAERNEHPDYYSRKRLLDVCGAVVEATVQS